MSAALFSRPESRISSRLHAVEVVARETLVCTHAFEGSSLASEKSRSLERAALLVIEIR